MSEAAKRQKELVGHLARLGGHREQVKGIRAELLRRANEQLDSIGRTIHVVEQHVESGAGGGILGQRRLRTLLEERARLQRAISTLEARAGEPDDA